MSGNIKVDIVAEGVDAHYDFEVEDPRLSFGIIEAGVRKAIKRR